MGSFELIIFILLFSVIQQIFSDHPVFACTLADESFAPQEFRIKRSHAFEKNIEKKDETSRLVNNMLTASKYQTPKTRPMNLCITEPAIRRRTPLPVVQTKRVTTATVLQPKTTGTASFIQPKDASATIIQPKVATATVIQPKPVATTTVIHTRVPVTQPQIVPTVSVEHPKCVSIASVVQPNSDPTATVIQPKAVPTATIIQTHTEASCAKSVPVTEIANCSLSHHDNSTGETRHMFHDIHGNSNDSLKHEHHYVVDVPTDHHCNGTNTIQQVIVNQTHSVNGKDSKPHEHGGFYEESSGGAKIIHSVSHDTSQHTEKSKTVVCPTTNSTITVFVQNNTNNKVCSGNEKPIILDMASPKPNAKQDQTKTLTEVLKEVNIQLLSTPKPLQSGKIDGIHVVENKMEASSLDQIKIEPDDDIVIDKFDVEEVKESYKNPSDITNDESVPSSSSAGWYICPTVNNEGIQSTNGAIIPYDEYVNYYNNPSRGTGFGGYKDNLRDMYVNNNHCKTPTHKTKRQQLKQLNNVERNILKDRIWRKWINTQIYIRRPNHQNAAPDINEHVKSTSWSHEQKIPVIGYNGYYTNQNSRLCS